jgi:hypothetical protein
VTGQPGRRNLPPAPATLTAMTDPAQVDLSAEADNLVQRTDNGWHEGDPEEQPPQDPAHLPEGTETGGGQ